MLGTHKTPLNLPAKALRKIANIYRSNFSPTYQLFSRVKSSTNGYLPPEVYMEMYNRSLHAPPGIIVDIGPAQGASSISLGLGVKESGKQSKIYSIDKFAASNALPSQDDVQLNVKTISDNLSSFSVEETNTLLVGGVLDVYDLIPQDQPISLLFIDADGALDRDFKLFYNRLIDGATVIIDDYQDKINRWAFQKYLKWETKAEMDRYVEEKGVNDFIELCPLGKEFTTYRLVNYFIEQGLLVDAKVLGYNTLFAKKAAGKIFGEAKHYSDIQQIRSTILDQYYSMREFPLAS